MRAFAAIVRRDLVLAWRIGGGGGNAVAFFLLVVTLVPLGVGPDPALLSRIAPGILWVGALLSTLLSLDRLFQADWEDGSLDLLAASSVPLEAVALAKILAHWLSTGLPLTLAAPVLGLLLDLPVRSDATLVAALGLGAPYLSLIGGIGAALTAGIRRGGFLLSLLVLPLYVPVLIFGVAAVEAALRGDPSGPALMVLGGLTLSALVLAPLAAAAALRSHLG
jgi:heme exporter protein B